MSRRWKNKVVVITGGARGLGLALAREFVTRGSKVAICSRNKDELSRAKADLLSIPDALGVFDMECDVSDAKQVEEFCKAAETALGPIDVLVNNAGAIQMGPYVSMTAEDHEEVQKGNLWGVINTCQYLAPKMIARRDGLIVNITSIGGIVPVPHLLPYTASKFGAYGFSTALYVELRKYGVHVLTVAPWLMRTGSYLNVLLKGKKLDEFKWFNFLANAPLVSMDTEKAVRKIVRAAESRRSILVLGWKAKASRLFFSLFPRMYLRFFSAVDRALPQPNAIHEPGAVQGKLLHINLPDHASKRAGDQAAGEFNQSFAKGGEK